jgi:hypothetical protein
VHLARPRIEYRQPESRRHGSTAEASNACFRASMSGLQLHSAGANPLRERHPGAGMDRALPVQRQSLYQRAAVAADPLAAQVPLDFDAARS